MTDPLAELSRGPAIIEALAECRTEAAEIARGERQLAEHIRRHGDSSWIRSILSPFCGERRQIGLQRALLRLGRLMLGASVR